MTNPKTQQEPSMEEILASIRRIISDDSAAEEAEAEEGQKISPEGGEDDILELTEVVEEAEPSAMTGGSEGEKPPEREGEAGAQPKVETAAVGVPEPEPSTGGGAEPGTDIETEGGTGEGGTSAIAPAEEAAGGKKPAPPEAAEEIAGAAHAGVVSRATSAATTASLKELVHALNRGADESIPLGTPNLTLQEIVKDLLRPMLREWLDENLQGLVERIVRKEIARIVREAEDLSEET